MAGRPVNEAYREERKNEVDAAIALIKQRNRPVSRKAIAVELGVSVQSLYGTGFLSCYIKELEALGVIDPEKKYS